jgi:hypothetical protein
VRSDGSDGSYGSDGSWIERQCAVMADMTVMVVMAIRLKGSARSDGSDGSYGSDGSWIERQCAVTAVGLEGSAQ